MDQITKAATITLLQVNRRATELQRTEAEQLERAQWALVEAARSYGITWNEIAHHLGYPNGHALRMARARAHPLANTCICESQSGGSCNACRAPQGVES